jgi:hypothetical protein
MNPCLAAMGMRSVGVPPRQAWRARRVGRLIGTAFCFVAGGIGYFVAQWWLMPSAIAGLSTHRAAPWWFLAILYVLVVAFLALPVVLLLAWHQERGKRAYLARLFLWFGILEFLLAPILWGVSWIVWASYR